MTTSRTDVTQRRPIRSLGSAPSLLIMCVLILYPLASLLIQIVFPDVFSAHMSWRFNPSDLLRVLQDPIDVESVLNSLWIGAVAAILCTIVGTVTAFGSILAPRRAKALINTCVWVIFFAPSFVIASGWVVLLQAGGVIPQLFQLSPDAFNWFFTPIGLFLVMGLRYFPFAHFALTQAIQNIGGEYIRAGRMLGANRRTIFIKIWLKLLAPALMAGATIAFAEGFGDFGLASVITPNMQIPLVSFQIYSSLFALPADFSSAAVLSLLVIIVTGGAIMLQFWWLNRRSYGTISGSSSMNHARLDRSQRVIVGLAIALVLVGLILPMSGTVIQSFWKNNYSGFAASNWTLSNYTSALGVGDLGLAALRRTAEYALITSVVVMVLGLYIGQQLTFNKSVTSRILNTIIMATIAIPGIVLGCGFVFGWNATWLTPFHLAIYGTPVCLGLAYVAVHLPYAIRLQLSAMMQISPNLLTAAELLGARKRLVLRSIVIPLVLETTVSTFLISFTGVMFELSAASMLYPSGQPTISVVIDHLFNDTRWAPGSALSIVGMVVVFGSYVLGNLLLRRVLGGGGLSGAWGAVPTAPAGRPVVETESSISVTP